MKKIMLLILVSLSLLSCVKKQEVSESKDDFLKVPEYKTEAYVPATTNSPVVAPAFTGSETYWYVRFDEVQEDAKGNLKSEIDYHKAIMLSTPYFDFVEARKALPVEVSGECYFNYILQINKETYDSYMTYRTEYFK